MDEVAEGGARADCGAVQPQLGQYFTGQLGEFPPDRWCSVEDHSWTEDPVEDVNDRVPDEGPGSAVVLLDLVRREV